MEKSNKRRYTLIVISFLFLLVATFVTVYNFKDTRAELSLGFIEDENLRECISNTNVNSIDEITSLTCTNKDVESLVGLNNLSNLTELKLSSNNISDISALSRLNNLTELSLRSNNISNISVLSGLNNLTSLNLSYNGISNISALSRLNNLTSLDLSYNNISNISALSGLNNLNSLKLSSNNISNISALNGLNNLKYLHLDSNNISDISALSGLNNLNSLKLSSNNISDISALSRLNNLKYLYLDSNNIDISNISVLSGLNNLTSLDLSYNNINNISNISALSGLNNLTSLNLSSNNISDISALSGLNNLNSLKLSSNNISNISALSGLNNLKYLYLDSNNIDISNIISVLSRLNNLTELSLRSNNISNISVLSGLNNLTSLDLSYNGISNISALSRLNNLTSMNLSSNNISDISALSGLNNLKHLNLDSNNISDISALSGLNNLNTLKLSSNNISDISALSGLNNLFLLYLYNNNLKEKNGICGSSCSYGTQVIFNINDGTDDKLYQNRKKGVLKPDNPTRSGYIFDGWFKDASLSEDSEVNFDSESGLSTNVDFSVSPVTLYAKWKLSSPTTTYSVKFNFNVPGSVVSTYCTCSGQSKICSAFDSNPTENFDYVVSTGSSIQLPTISCPGINKKIKDWSGNTGSFKPTANTILKANWGSINSGDNSSKYSSSSDLKSDSSSDLKSDSISIEYEIVLNKNCSGTFVCSSTTNSEVCTQLKNNGKFTKTVTKGDTFVFPKTFDTLTCDGKEISSWGSFDLGYELNVTSDVTASAKWKSSSGGGNTPSNDEYTVTLNRNCSGTFVCNSTTNSSVCEQLKNNGKFTKTVTKGDTFVFPKTFDTLTCDGKEISSWGSYSLGTNITVNKNIDIDAAWESSNGGGDTPDPSQNDDPIDNPQTGSIVIYLVLLFGIGALVYSVWYFRGFRKN